MFHNDINTIQSAQQHIAMIEMNYDLIQLRCDSNTYRRMRSNKQNVAFNSTLRKKAKTLKQSYALYRSYSYCIDVMKKATYRDKSHEQQKMSFGKLITKKSLA